LDKLQFAMSEEKRRIPRNLWAL